MSDGWWAKPVRVMLGTPSQMRIVASTRDAAECLSDYWPLKRGFAHRTAQEACLTVLAGEELTYVARLAFIEAAREAGILVEDGNNS